MTLRELANARRSALKRGERLGDQLGRVLSEQHAAGRTIKELSRETGYSRRQIYNLMGRNT